MNVVQNVTWESLEDSTLAGGTLPRNALAGRSPRERLTIALEDICIADPPRTFAGSYILINERVAAGQGIVNFGRNRCGIECSSRCT